MKENSELAEKSFDGIFGLGISESNGNVLLDKDGQNIPENVKNALNNIMYNSFSVTPKFNCLHKCEHP